MDLDPSALIFVALAVAWAVYLIPKALEAGDGAHGGAIERFSSRLKVLARREPASVDGIDLAGLGDEERKYLRAEARAARREARQAAKEQIRQTRRERRSARRTRRDERRLAAAEAWLAAPPAARRRVASAAAARRRRVLGLLLLATAVVAGLAGYGLVDWPWVAVPGGVVLTWLVVCRLMVRREVAVRRAALEQRRNPRPKATPVEEQNPVRAAAMAVDPEATGELAAFLGEELEGSREVRYDPVTGSWDPVPMQLPTYVNKERAARSVRTIDLDSTGVWSSGRSEADSALAREAEAQEEQARQDAAARPRATGT